MDNTLTQLHIQFEFAVQTESLSDKNIRPYRDGTYTGNAYTDI